MADNSYMTREINNEGVAPLKDQRDYLNYLSSVNNVLNSKYIGQYKPNLGRLDRVTDPNIGDASYLSPEELQNRRYNLQSHANRIWRGWKNMGTVTYTTALDTILGNVFSIISGTWDNEVSKFFNKVQEDATKRNQIYRPSDYNERSVASQLLSSVFIGDFLQNTGFTVGSMLGTLPLAALGLSGPLAVIVPSVVGAFAEARTEGLGAKNKVLDERLQALSYEYNARRAEATSQEEIDAIDRWYADKSFEIHADSNTVGNSVYTNNAFLLMATNMLGWGPVFKASSSFTKQLAKKMGNTSLKFVGENGKKLAKGFSIDDIKGVATKGKGLATTKNIANLLKEAGSESFEEVAQGIISSAAEKLPSVNDFSLSGEDYESRKEIDSSWDAFIEATKEAFQDKSTAIEAIMGGLTSIIGVPYIKPRINKKNKKSVGISWGGSVKEFIEQQKLNKRNNDIIKEINDNLASDKTQNILKNLVIAKDLEAKKKEAAILNNTFNIKNYALGELIATTSAFDSAGSIKTLLDMMDSVQSLSDEELNKLAANLTDEEGNKLFVDTDNTINTSEVRKQVDKNISELKSIVEDYLKDKQTLEASGLDLTEDVKRNYIYGKAQIKDWVKRKEQIASELYDIYLKLTEKEERREDKDSFIRLISDSKNFRELFLRELNITPNLTPDQYEEIVQKVLDVRKINKGIEKYKNELTKIWKNPADAVEKTLTEAAEAVEKNRQFKLAEEANASKEVLLNSPTPINSFIEMLEDENNDNYITPEQAAVLMDILESSDDERENNLADDLQSVYETVREVVSTGNVSGISDVKIQDIISKLKSNEVPYTSIEDFTNNLDTILTEVLSKEELEAYNKAKKDAKKVNAATDSDKKGIFESASEEEEDTEDTENDSEVEDDWDEASREEAIEVLEKNGGEELFPNYPYFDREEAISAVRALNKGYVSKNKPFNPEEYTINGNPKSKKEDRNYKSDEETPAPVHMEEGEVAPSGVLELNESEPISEEIVDARDEKAGFTKKDEIVTEPQEDFGNEDALAVGRWGSLYDINFIKKNILKFKTEAGKSTAISRLIMQESNIEEFINKGYLYEWIKEKKAKGEPLTVYFALIRPEGKVVKTKNLPLVAVIPHEKGNEKVYYGTKATKVQVLGVVSPTFSERLLTSKKRELTEEQKKQAELYKKLKEEAVNNVIQINPKDGFSNLMLVNPEIHSELEFVFSGRYIKEDQTIDEPLSREYSYYNLLDVVPKKEDGSVDDSNLQLVFYTSKGVRSMGEPLDGEEIPLNIHNRNRKVGIHWLKVREGNGQIFHKYVKTKIFNSKFYPIDGDYAFHKETPIYKSIEKAVKRIIKDYNNISEVGKALNELYNHLYFPRDKQIFVNTKTGIVRVGNTRIDITGENAFEDFMELLYSSGLKFNVGRLTLKELITSDIFLTDLAKLFNVGHSILIKQVAFDEDNKPYTIDSEKVKEIVVHTGNKGFLNGRERIVTNIEGKEYYKTDDGFYYEGDKQITDPYTIFLINTYLDIQTKKLNSKKYYKNNKTLLYEVEFDGILRYFIMKKSKESTYSTLHELTRDELEDYKRDVFGLNKKKKLKDNTVSIGGYHVPVKEFGKAFYRADKDYNIELFNNGSNINFNPIKEDVKEGPIVGVLNEKAGKINIVPNYARRKVLSELRKGDKELLTILNYFYNIEGTLEEGEIYIPKITKQATTDLNGGSLVKGNIKWINIKDLNLEDKESESDESPLKVSDVLGEEDSEGGILERATEEVSEEVTEEKVDKKPTKEESTSEEEKPDIVNSILGEDIEEQNAKDSSIEFLTNRKSKISKDKNKDIVNLTSNIIDFFIDNNSLDRLKEVLKITKESISDAIYKELENNQILKDEISKFIDDNGNFDFDVTVDNIIDIFNNILSCK